MTAGSCARDRRRTVRVRWRGHLWDWEGFARWHTWGARRYSYLVAFACLVAVCYLDVNHLNGRGEAWWPSSLLHESPAGRAVLAALILINGLVVGTHLAMRAAPGERSSHGLRLARLALALPILGPVLIAATVAGRRGAGPPKPPAVRSPGSWAAHRRRSRLGGLLRSVVRSGNRSLPWMLAWLVVLQIVPFLALLSWLATASKESPAGRGAAVAASAVLHLVLLVATRRHVAALARVSSGGAMGLALRVSPFLVLLPAPAALFGIAGWLPWARENRDESTLVHAAFERRGLRADRLWSAERRREPAPAEVEPAPATEQAAGRSVAALLRQLAAELRAPFDSPRLRAWWGHVGPENSRRLAFFRLKTFLLALEAAAFSWAVAWLCDGRTVLDLDDRSRALIPFLVLIALGAVVEAVFLGHRLFSLVTLRPATVYRPVGRHLAAGQAALLTGLLLGSELASGDVAGAGLVLMGSGIVAAVLLLLVVGPLSLLLAVPGREVVAPLAWGALLFEVVVLGAVLFYQPEAGGSLVRLVAGAVALAPVLTLALGPGLGRSTIEPYRRPGPLGEPGPGAVRARRLLAACAYLPGGGLAIPLWAALAPDPVPAEPDRRKPEA